MCRRASSHRVRLIGSHFVSCFGKLLLPLKQYCRSVVQSWFKFVEMSQNGPFFGHPSCNIALKEAKLGQNRVQKWCAQERTDGRIDGRTDGRTDAHQIFEAPYTKALRAINLLSTSPPQIGIPGNKGALFRIPYFYT